MGVLDPVPYMGVCEPYIGVRLWVEVIPLCLFAPLRVKENGASTEQKVRAMWLNYYDTVNWLSKSFVA